MAIIPLLAESATTGTFPARVPKDLIPIRPNTSYSVMSEIALDEFTRDIATRAKLAIIQDAEVVQSSDAVKYEWPNPSLEFRAQPSATPEFHHGR